MPREDTRPRTAVDTTSVGKGKVTPLPEMSDGGPVGTKPKPKTPRLSTGSPKFTSGYNFGENDGVNQNKGGFKSDVYRKGYDDIANQIQKMYDEQMPVLKNYMQVANEQLYTLIGQTVPEVQEMFREASAAYGYATENYMSAKGYDTPERRAEERSKAMSDVRVAGDAARNQALEKLDQFGIDPSQTRGQALDATLRLNTALEEVRAAKAAETGVEERGRAYTSTALEQLDSATRTSASVRGAGAEILGRNAAAASDMTRNAINVGNFGSGLLQAKGSLIQNSESAKRAEQASKAALEAARQGASAANAAGIGQFIGTAGGAIIGGIATGGNPMGIAAGAQAGGTLGGATGAQQ